MQHARYAVCVVVVVASLCLSPLATYQGDVAWAAARGTLRVAVVGFDRESTAPWESSTPMLPYIGNMYDPLIAADDTGQLSKEGLVTDWQSNEAGDIVTLTIRSGVKFHNGAPLTAEDVKFSFETWKEQTGGSPSLTGAALRGILKRVNVVNDQQVRCTCRARTPSFCTCSPGWKGISVFYPNATSSRYRGRRLKRNAMPL